MIDWQQLCALLIVAATAFLLVRRSLRRRRLALLRGCAHDCGCSPNMKPFASTVKRRIVDESSMRDQSHKNS